MKEKENHKRTAYPVEYQLRQILSKHPMYDTTKRRGKLSYPTTTKTKFTSLEPYIQSIK
jgi:hypothetical protein